MTNKKKNIALLLGDPSGIGPELISKLLTQNELSNANITVIGEKNILNSGDKISGNNSDLEIVTDFNDINFEKKNKYFFLNFSGFFFTQFPTPKNRKKILCPFSA